MLRERIGLRMGILGRFALFEYLYQSLQRYMLIDGRVT